MHPAVGTSSKSDTHSRALRSAQSLNLAHWPAHLASRTGTASTARPDSPGRTRPGPRSHRCVPRIERKGARGSAGAKRECEGEGEREGRAWAFGPFLAPVSVGASQLDLALPKRCQVHSCDAGHTDQDDPAAGAHDVEGLFQGVPGPDTVDDEIDATGQSLDAAVTRF